MITLDTITAKVHNGERLADDDALFLLETADLPGLGELAAQANARHNGTTVYFNVNRHLNYSNICINHCRFCAFRRDKDDTGAYLLDLDAIRAIAMAAHRQGATEIHMVGGLYPDLPLDYYCQMLRTVKAVSDQLHLKAFTAVEIDHVARCSGLTVRQVLLELKEAGLDSLPGGGAEIFAAPVRAELCAEKISGERWLEIMAEVHQCGLRSNATMLYGHRESYRDRVDHLARLRQLQDRTGGFQAFIPLPFQTGGTALGQEVSSSAGGVDDLRTIAVARLYLDNFRHIKAYWVLLGEKIAQVALTFGANDLDGTVVEEKIGHAAGADSPTGLSREQIMRLIRQAGREPVERDSLYRQLTAKTART
jgi:aminodeoxyfutalosine synthase